ncbi:hypothetical protein [Streptomyces sp. GC420]|uniref:hypothetical protein n=1 Tax=Streptomyces sp. GC420 TaxID=2697568 RepID=UPI00141509C4|nr:hypothetical protein [Streptomyces sp. GC420]NBM14978.1 hypothetical protein [Streptomyces sp. GC420]
MGASVKGMLVTSLEDLRLKEGMTTQKLRKPEHAVLRQMLGAATAEEAYQRLSELVLAMPDTTTTRAVRNALVIGDDIEARNGLDDRRAWAYELLRKKGETLFPGSRSSAIRHETSGLKEIAQILIDRQQQLIVPVEEAPWSMEENRSILDAVDWDALAAHDDRHELVKLWIVIVGNILIGVCMVGILVSRENTGFIGSTFILATVVAIFGWGITIGVRKERGSRYIILKDR